MRSSAPCLAFGLSLLVVSVIGCTDTAARTYPVRGIVRFPDGKLLRDGSIEFEILGRDDPVTARGIIGPDGSFGLGTFELEDGALVGKHRVVVFADYMIGGGAERPGLIPEQQLDPKFRDYRRSGLVYEVKPELNNIVVEVDYAKQGDKKTGQQP
jgi:hypothetical protein